MGGSAPQGVSFRRAEERDLPAVIALLAEGSLVKGRDDASLPLDPGYLATFHAMDADQNTLLIVGEIANEVLACMQISFIPGLTYRGGWRAHIEGVRVADRMRGKGIGHALMEEAMRLSRERGCKIMQLFTHNDRRDAHRFYESLGFERNHLGFRRAL